MASHCHTNTERLPICGWQAQACHPINDAVQDAMNEENPDQAWTELRAQFGRAGLRELHVRCGEFEIYLSNDPSVPVIFGKRSGNESTSNRAET
jgi:hypothetical protein